MFGRLRRLGRLRKFGKLGGIWRFGRLGNSVIRGKKGRNSWNPGGFRGLGVWGIWKIGKFRRLADCGSREIGGAGKIFLLGDK